MSSASMFFPLYILFAMLLSGRHTDFLVFQQNCLHFVDEFDLKTELHNKRINY